MGLLTSLTILLALAGPQSDITIPSPAQGLALEYSPGLMEQSAAYHRVPWYKGITGFTSVPDCRYLGDLVDATVGGVHGLWRVADCTRARDKAALRDWHHLGPVVMEVWNQTARWGGWDWYLGHRGPGHVRAVIQKIIRLHTQGIRR